MTSQKITVLVVEDEPLLRMSTVDELVQYGFEVTEASNAREAIAIFRAGKRFQCLFTDVDMPGDADGLELANMVKRLWPPIDVIVTSGHRDVQQSQLPQDGLFIGKPYSPDIIAGLIRNLTSSSNH